MKAYAVVYYEDGRYIGHGLYDTHKVTCSVHTTQEGAKRECDKIYNDGGPECDIEEIEIEE